MSEARIVMNCQKEPPSPPSSSAPLSSPFSEPLTTLYASDSVLGNAVNTTPTPKTIATSSSCETPASFAASSSSREMEKEIVKDRSDPSEERDSDIEGSPPQNFLPPPRPGQTCKRRVTKKALENAINENVGLQIDAREQIFVFRRLLVTSRHAKEPRGSRRGSGLSRVSSYTTEGGLFGCVFSHLSNVCRDRLRIPREKFKNTMFDAFMPIAKNLKQMKGPDVKYLARGLGTHRVIRSQYPKLCEITVAPQIQKRDGHRACAFGATAAIYVLFHMLASEKRPLELGGPLDEGGLGTQFEKVVEATAGAFADWPLLDLLDAPALEAELRALQRAYVGIRLARMCDVQHESVEEAFARRLRFYAQCVWPTRGFALGREKHYLMLDAIISGSIASDKWVRADNCFVVPMLDDGSVIPLSALDARDLRGRGEDDDSSYTMTAPSTMNSSSFGDAESVDDSLEELHQSPSAEDVNASVQDALRVASMAIAAASSVV